MSNYNMKTIVLGVGNSILCDDGVGIHVVRQLKKHVKDRNVIIDEALTGEMNLLDLILGYDKAILIDALKTRKTQIGKVYRYSIDDFKTGHTCNPHDVSLPEAIELAKKIGEEKIPQESIAIGIGINDNSNNTLVFGEDLSSLVANAIPKAVNMTLSEINNMNMSS